MKRVVITGMGAVSPFGRGVEILLSSLIEGKSGIRREDDLAAIGGLRCRLAGFVPGTDPREIPRKFRRSMSSMSVFAVLACREALQQAGLGKEECAGGKMGIAIGSSTGSIQATQEFFENFLNSGSLEQMKSTVFFKIMNHSCAANISKFLGITGRILSPSAACSTSCQAIGYGYEMIAFGRQQYMLCGGADEFHPLTAGTFDILNAASINFNEQPHRTPRPFDRDRDGVVCSEGSGIILLESLASAKKRGAAILGEIIGFSTISDQKSIANPDAVSIEFCMRESLRDAGIEPQQIDYINAHATATEQGDVAESEGIFRLFGSHTPVSSFKGHLGHTLAASGSLESCALVGMLNRQCLIPTLNLENVDESCNQIKHVKALKTERLQTVLKNNFALGGVNSSLVIRRFQND